MDILEQLHDVSAVPPVSEERLARLRARLAVASTASAPPVRRRFLRVPQRVLAMVAAVVVTSGSVAAWAVVSSQTNPSTTTTIECGQDTYIPVETGNPILDCYSALANQEATVPPLIGWITPTGLVAVLPTGQAPPAGSRPLPASFQVDAGIRYATDALGDVAGPLMSGCLDPSAATAYATSQLAIAGLTRFQVTMRSSGTASSCPSYFTYLDPQHQSADLIPEGSWSATSASNVTVVLDQELAKQLNGSCTTTSDAEALARSDAASLGIADQALLVSAAGAIGSSSSCATAFVEPGGAVDVVVWQVGQAG